MSILSSIGLIGRQGRGSGKFLLSQANRMMRGMKQMAASRQKGGRFPRRRRDRRRRLQTGGRFKKRRRTAFDRISMGGRRRLKMRGSYF